MSDFRKSAKPDMSQRARLARQQESLEECGREIGKLRAALAEKEKEAKGLRENLAEAKRQYDESLGNNCAPFKARIGVMEKRCEELFRNAETAERDSIENVRKAKINWDRAEAAEREAQALKARVAEFDKSIVSEMRDPNGTIWEVANQFLSRAEAAERDVKVRTEERDSYLEAVRMAEREVKRLREERDQERGLRIRFNETVVRLDQEIKTLRAAWSVAEDHVAAKDQEIKTLKDLVSDLERRLNQ